MDEFILEWVKPYYMQILRGNFVHTEGPKREDFQQRVKHALSTIDAPVIERLLTADGWREQITGSWFCGLKGWKHFEDQIGEALIASEVAFAGQGFCFALACFSDDKSARYLMQYLDTYLPQTDRYYDQSWAMPALMWIDAQRATEYSVRYLVAGGLWETFTANKIASSDAWKLDVCKRHFWEVMEYCCTYFN
jgi:hypothetical protein